MTAVRPDALHHLQGLNTTSSHVDQVILFSEQDPQPLDVLQAVVDD
jgi:hypothetical protein